MILQPSGGGQSASVGLDEIQPVSLSSISFDLHTHVIAHMGYITHMYAHIDTQN